MNEDKIREAAKAAFKANERVFMLSMLNSSELDGEDRMERYIQYCLAKAEKAKADSELAKLIYTF